MIRSVVAWALVAVAVAGMPADAADPPKDTTSAAFTRTKKLKGKVTVDFKNEFLKAAFEEMTSQLQDQKLGAISVHYGVGVSQNTRITYSGKDVTVEEALDGILKQLDLGYHVVSKDKDRYDGWIEVNKGTHRGYPPGVTAPKVDPKAEPKVDPKPEPKVDPKPPASDDPDEKQARSRLDLAKECVEMGKKEDAGRLLKYVLKNFPKTKAAEEAKDLMDKIK
jgi:FimV-like protein